MVLNVKLHSEALTGIFKSCGFKSSVLLHFDKSSFNFNVEYI